MLARLVVLIATLCFLVRAADAANLRVLASDNEATPQISLETASRIARNAVKALGKIGENSHKDTVEMMKSVHAEAAKGKEQHKASGFTTTSNMQTQSWDQNVRFGSVVMRHRPNGDCSGIPSMVVADRIEGGECMPRSTGGSYFLSCVGDNDTDGEIQMIKNVFPNNPNCQPDVGYFSETLQNDDRCNMIQPDGMELTVPTMKTRQCSTKNVNFFATDRGGIASYSHYGNTACNSSPDTVVVQRFHTCELTVLYYHPNGTESDYPTYNDMNEFYYTSFDGCAPHGKMTVSVHADPACRRRLGTFNVDVRDNGQCQVETSGTFQWSRRTVCVPEPGHQ